MVNNTAVLLRVSYENNKLVEAENQELTSAQRSLREGMVSAYRVSDFVHGEPSTENGEVWLEDEFILYMPETVGAGGFNYGGYRFDAEVGPSAPETPVIVFPKPGASLSYPELEAAIDTVFVNHPDYYCTHVEWELGDDASFTNILYATTDEGDLKRVLYEGLQIGNTYYLRARVVADVV